MSYSLNESWRDVRCGRCHERAEDHLSVCTGCRETEHVEPQDHNFTAHDYVGCRDGEGEFEKWERNE